MRVLVTGGTGFVGMRVVHDLSSRGHEVVSLSRGVQSKGHPYPVTNVKVDLVRPHGLEDALENVESVVHAAGILRESSGQSYERAHVGGTENLVAACRRTGIKKIVYLSALGAQRGAANPYLKTKWEGERIIENSGIEWTVFRPSLIFGAGDRLISHLLRLIRLSPFVPDLGPDDARIQPVWVGDVATAVARSILDHSTNGHIYELGGPAAMSCTELLQLLKSASGRRGVSIRLPQVLSEPLARLGERIFNAPPMIVDQLGLMALGGTCDPNPAAVTFGLRMRSLADVLPEYR